MLTKLSHFTKLRRIAAVLMALLCTAVFTVLSSEHSGGRRLFQHTIMVSGTQVVVHDELALNAFAQEDFSSEEGRALCLSTPFRTGIDVSAHQGKVNWKKAAEDGISFAMLRCGFRGYGSGTICEDEYFAKNAKKAAKAGLDLGVYFFSQAISVEEAVEEANFVLDMVEGLPLTLPIVFDWEVIAADQSGANGARTDNMDGETLTACALAFCDTIRSAGYQPMLYCNSETGYFLYDIAQIQETGLPIWFASFHTDWPSYYYHMDWWQYTDKGTVNGIEGNVDLTIWPLETDPADNTGDGTASSYSKSG